MKAIVFFMPVPIPLPMIVYKETSALNKTVYKDNIFDLINKGNIKSVYSSIIEGTSINLKNSKGQTLLHYAVCHNQIEIAKLLIYLGADLQAIDNHGQKIIDVIHDNHQEVLLKKHTMESFTALIEPESAASQQVDELGATYHSFCEIM